MMTNPAAVNLTPLPTRLTSTCRRSAGSPTSEAGTSASTIEAMKRPFACARGASMSTTPCNRLSRSNSVSSTSTRSLSSFAKSRTSLTMSRRFSAEPRSASTYCRCLGSSGMSRIESARPTIPFSGVRISWLIIARNPACRALSGVAADFRKILPRPVALGDVGATDDVRSAGHDPGVDFERQALWRLALVCLRALQRGRQHLRAERRNGRLILRGQAKPRTRGIGRQAQQRNRPVVEDGDRVVSRDRPGRPGSSRPMRPGAHGRGFARPAPPPSGRHGLPGRAGTWESAGFRPRRTRRAPAREERFPLKRLAQFRRWRGWPPAEARSVPAPRRERPSRKAMRAPGSGWQCEVPDTPGILKCDGSRRAGV